MESHRPFPRVGPFLWLFLQAASVVASILLAFAIDAWWGSRVENEQKNTMLRAIRGDLASFSSGLEGLRVYREASRSSVMVLLGAMASGQYDDTEKTLDHRLGDLTWFSTTPERSRPLEALIQGGGLDAVENPQLRTALIEYPYWLEQMHSVTSQDLATYNEVVVPFLSRNASLPQISNASYEHGRPGDGYGADPEAKVPLGKTVDHSYLLGNREFAGLLIRKLSNDSDVLYNIEPFRTATLEVIRLIDLELSETS
jgi:hypothetical protein